MDEVRITRIVFERYWREANADRMKMIADDEIKRLIEYHWALLLGARLNEETDKLLRG